MIPLPRASTLTGAMLIGAAVGLLAGVLTTLLVQASVRPDVVIGLVVGVPGVIGMLAILLSTQRWVTTMGAFVLAIAPGWFGVLALTQVVTGA